jgi:GNAT superfamily N-acetyltransferase
MIAFEPFQEDDLSILEEFTPAGWGDLLPRFTHFLQAAYCFPFKMIVNGEVTAIGTNILHADTAWLACIIVHENFRNKGYGRLITQFLVEVTQKQGFQTIYLEATELGFPVYVKLGFETETNYHHFGPAKCVENPTASTLIQPFDERYREQVLKLDQSVSGEDRLNSLQEHLKDSQLYVHNNNLLGFYLPTLGDGLIIAGTKEAGCELMTSRLRDRAYATVPQNNEDAIQFLHSYGLIQSRVSWRMRLGKKRPAQFSKMYNRISGQLG